MEYTDRKILLCYVLASLPCPLDRKSLCRTLSEVGKESYFDLCDAVEALLREDSLTEGDEGLTVTERGRQLAASFHRRLPAAERERVVEGCLRLLESRRLKKENPTFIEEKEDGSFLVTLCVKDGDADLLRLTLSVCDREQAEAVCRRFEKDPTLIYTGVIALLAGDLDAVGGALLSSAGSEK